MYPNVPAVEELEAVLAVASTGSISMAARESGIHQQTMSARIARAERSLGFDLFDRSPYGVSPTERGAEILGAIPELLGACQHFSSLASTLLADDSPRRLSIAVSNTVAEIYYPGWAATFHAGHPSVRLTMLQANSHKVREMVAEGTVPLGIVEGGQPRHDLEEVAIGTDELAVAVPKGHPWEQRAIISAELLRSTQLIVREPGSGSRRVIEDALGNMAEPAGEFGSLSAQRSGILALNAPAIISTGAIADQVTLGKITILPAEIRFDRPISAVLRRGYEPSDDIAEFIGIAAS